MKKLLFSLMLCLTLGTLLTGCEEKTEIKGSYDIYASQDLLNFFDVIVEYGENSNLNTVTLTAADFTDDLKYIPFNLDTAPASGKVKATLKQKFEGKVECEKDVYNLSFSANIMFSKIEVEKKKPSKTIVNVIDKTNFDFNIIVNGVQIDANTKLNAKLQSLIGESRSASWWVDENAEYNIEKSKKQTSITI